MAQKKYKVITKIGNNLDGTALCVKYNCSDLVSYCKFLDSRFPNWSWSNVFDKQTKLQIGNFTKNNRPLTKRPY